MPGNKGKQFNWPDLAPLDIVWPMKRREFLGNAAATAAMLTVFPATLAGLARETSPGRIERRALGKTGLRLSLIGFGGKPGLSHGVEDSKIQIPNKFQNSKFETTDPSLIHWAEGETPTPLTLSHGRY
jgi:hypothetical protein